MNKTTLLMVCLLGGLFATGTFGQSPVDKTKWLQLSLDTDKDATRLTSYWYQKDSVTFPKSKTVKFWMRNQTYVEKKWRAEYTLTLVEINCADQEFYFRNQIEYNAKGEVESNISDLFKGQFETVVPDTIIADIAQKMCSLEKPKN